MNTSRTPMAASGPQSLEAATLRIFSKVGDPVAVAEVQQHHQRLMRDLMRERGITAPAAARTETPATRRIERFFRWFGRVSPVAEVVLSVPWRLRHPRRLTVLAIAMEAPNVGYEVLRAARAVQRRRPRMAAGSAPGRSRIGSPAAGIIG
ncbi:MAG: hypothetical protein ACRDOL_08475 [Streptosporangiaceae bacterium]